MSFVVFLRQALSRSLGVALLGFTLLAATPLLAPAQTSGDNGPVMGKVAPGQQANQLEGTTESTITYVANVIMPMIGVVFLIVMIFLLKTNRGGWVASLVTAMLCFMISGIARLIEYHVTQGAGGIH
jgi:VIT1/CCC1 family predicted Fe2+/Mn2+ transporter